MSRAVPHGSPCQRRLCFTVLVVGLAAMAEAKVGSPAISTISIDLLPIDFLVVLAVDFVVLLSLLMLNALAIAAETSVSSLRNSHVKHMREEIGDKGSRLQELIADRPRYVTACLLASRLARLGTFLAVIWIGAEVAGREAHISAQSCSILQIVPWAVVIGLPALGVNLIVGELIPRSYAALHPHRVSVRLFPLMKAASTLLSVPAQMIVSLAEVLTARFEGRAAFDGAGLAEEEIKSLVESAEETGEIESDEGDLIHSVLAFNDTVAREIMTPRVDLDAMPVRSHPADVIRVIGETGHTRIPLFEETDDQIVGIVHAKDLLLAMNDGSDLELRTLMRPPLFVPEGKNLHELLQEMRANRSQMAVLQDEFGGTAGIVTTEDIVEQLVGDIVDEYDEEELSILRTEDGWIVNGKLHVDDVNDVLQSSFESEEFDTIGGLVFGQFGRQPKVGEKVDIDGYEFNVEETDGRRITRLLIRPCSPSEPV